MYRKQRLNVDTEFYTIVQTKKQIIYSYYSCNFIQQMTIIKLYVRSAISTTRFSYDVKSVWNDDLLST